MVSESKGCDLTVVEYLSNAFSAHLSKQGTERRLTSHDTPEENGVAERLNRTLIERVRALLHASQLPMALWGEALMHVVWLKNWTSTKSLLGHTPYEALTKEKPDLSKLHEWGEHIWVHDPDNPKLEGCAREGRWIGFDPQSHASHVYWPNK